MIIIRNHKSFVTKVTISMITCITDIAEKDQSDAQVGIQSSPEEVTLSLSLHSCGHKASVSLSE